MAKLPGMRKTPASEANTETRGQPSPPPTTEPSVDELGEAQALLQAGKVDKAANAFQKIRSRDANLEAHIGLIQDCQRRLEWGEGLQEAEVALTGFPDSAALAALKGELLLALNRMDEAEVLYASIKEKFPRNVVGFAGLATVASRRRDWKKASSRWQDCLKRFPDHSSVPGWRTSLANALLELGRLDEAEAEFIALRESYPTRVEGFAGVARCANRKRDFEESLVRWQECLDRFPDHASAPNWRAQLGNAFLELGRLEEAEGVFMALRESDPMRPEGFEGIARCANRKRDFEESLVRWQECLDRFPGHSNVPTWRAQLGTALLELGRIDEAEAVFAALHESEPTRPEGFEGMARCAHRSGDFERAWKRWQECIDRFPTHPGVSNWRARHNECADRV
ncbi:MAG: tetratricopeptide repeat protein [Gammaproteobacteria bacterium]